MPVGGAFWPLMRSIPYIQFSVRENGIRGQARWPSTAHDASRNQACRLALRERYKPQQEIPHGLLVLLMQMDRDKTLAGQGRVIRSLQRVKAAMPFHPDETETAPP